MTKDEVLRELKMMHSYYSQFNHYRCVSHCEALQTAIVAMEREWIPCEERMPDSAFGCLVTVWDNDPRTGESFENLYPEFVGWDGEGWNDYEGNEIPLEVIAWKKLPSPYIAESK